MQAAQRPLALSQDLPPDEDRKRVRWEARDLLRHISASPRLMRCGRTPVRAGGVQVRLTVGPTGAHAGYAGLSTCGNVWACPVCSAKILNRRTTEIQSGIAGWLGGGRGRRVAMLTLTLRHRQGQALSDLWDGLGAAWRRMGKQRSWLNLLDTYGVRGTIRVTEVTHGANGWHVHYHVILFCDQRLSRAWEEFAGIAFGMWRDSVEAQGFQALDKTGPQDFRVYKRTAQAAQALAEYVSKGVYSERVGSDRGLALEVTRSDMKAGKFGNRTPFQILRDLLSEVSATGAVDDDDLALWLEFESAARKRKAHVWSNGLRDLLGVGQESSDEDIAGEEVGTSADAIAEIPTEAWRAMFRLRPGATYYLLSYIERAAGDDGSELERLSRGVQACHEWLQMNGIARIQR